ncbi:MAG: HD domain-containing protein, partial [FCB group bacterium]|nr:HD domain-containing protein [FCB group bacterium]
QHVPVLYRGADSAFPDDVRQRLIERGVQYLYIECQHEKQYRQYLEHNLSDILADPGVSSAEKSEMLYLSATGIMEDVMADPRSGDVVPRSRNFVENTCHFLLEEKHALRHLLDITSYDYYTYTHSVNVFVFSMALAHRLDLFEPRQLRDLGEGALLHDLGKSLIDPEIINCPGKLSDEQWKEIRRHPVLGQETLQTQGINSPLALDVIRHHHEKLRGGGYPDGLVNGAISQPARICAIADIFDALTTKRSYKGALNSYPALELMVREMSEDLDKEFLGVFVRMMGNPD